MYKKILLIIFILLSMFFFAGFLPYSGVVLDAETNKPVKGVVVRRAWQKHTATVAGSTTSFAGGKETVTDEKGRFGVPGIVYPPHIPIMESFSELRPIFYKPGYKFVVLDKKIHRILMEKVPTKPDVRLVEVEKAREHYCGMVTKKEMDFIEHDKKIKTYNFTINDRIERRKRTKRRLRQIRNRKVERLKTHAKPEKVGSLIEKLERGSSAVMQNAAESLGHMVIERPEHLKALRRIAASQIDGWKKGCKKCVPPSYLGRIGAPVVEPLIRALKQEDLKLRRLAVIALKRTGDERALKALIKHLGDEDSGMLRATIVIHLKYHNTPEVVSALLDALNDFDPNVRSGSAKSLGVIGDARAIKPLISSLREVMVDNFAKEALICIGDPAADALIQALTDEDQMIRKHSAYILAFVDSSNVVDALISASNNNDPVVLPNVLYALGEHRNPKAVDVIIRNINHDDRNVRAQAIVALGKFKSQKALNALLHAMNDSYSFNREKVVVSLGRFGGDQAIQAIIKAWNDESTEVRRTAADVIVSIGTEAVDRLRSSLNNPDPYIRWRSALALGRIRSNKSNDDLIQLLMDDAPEVRWITIKAMGLIQEPRFIEPLIDFLDDNDVGIREQANLILKKITQQDFKFNMSQWQNWYRQRKKEQDDQPGGDVRR